MMLGGLNLDHVIMGMCMEQVHSQLRYKNGGNPNDDSDEDVILPEVLQK